MARIISIMKKVISFTLFVLLFTVGVLFFGRPYRVVFTEASYAHLQLKKLSSFFNENKIFPKGDRDYSETWLVLVPEEKYEEMRGNILRLHAPDDLNDRALYEPYSKRNDVKVYDTWGSVIRIKQDEGKIFFVSAGKDRDHSTIEDNIISLNDLAPQYEREIRQKYFLSNVLDIAPIFLIAFICLAYFIKQIRKGRDAESL